MKRNLAATIIGMALLFPTASQAVDPQSVRAYCDDIKQSAQNAQLRYIQTYQPRVDPGKTFEDATTSCLDFINKFNVGFNFQIPTLGDVGAMLQKAAEQMLQKTCQAAAQQFNKAVSDAQQSIGQATNGVNQLPGVNVGVSTGSIQPPGVSTTVKTDGGTAAQGVTDKAIDRIINFLK